MVGRRILVGAEGNRIDGWCGPRHGSELLPRNELPPPAERDELADAVTIPGDSESLPALDGIHDLLGPAPQVTLSDLWLLAHSTSLRRK